MFAIRARRPIMSNTLTEIIESARSVSHLDLVAFASETIESLARVMVIMAMPKDGLRIVVLNICQPQIKRNSRW